MGYHVGIGCSFGSTPHSVHKILAKKIGSELINLSYPGQGNFYMLTELSFWIGLNKDKLKDTTFSIGLSGIYRNDMIMDTPEISQDHEYFRGFTWTTWQADRDDDNRGRLKGGGYTVKHLPYDIHFELDHTIRYFSYVIAIQKLLESHGCKYVMYNAIDNYIPKSDFSTPQASRVAVFERQVNKDTFYDITSSQLKFIAEHKFFKDPTFSIPQRRTIRYPSDDTQFSVKDAHPSEQGDEEWAMLVWRFTKSKKIFTN